ncbi:hypothetical protein NE236_09390 [Actinoallomurus purpureus]|uniref:hypothetical protein n=1 Tax=Actinoallomurus purpureus TaxID=478114 RepID=UPI00209256B4|nr:hypothetical protein [Actinoallomurus purpureus]MCO6005197.1 hypothetical protein [Actinoallomurus purpureus]
MYPGLRPSGTPKFIVAAAGPVAVFDPPSAKEPTSYTPAHAVVLDAESGRVLHTITAPPGIFSSWSAVAAAPDDRTFVIGGTTGPGAGFAFYTVHLDDQGRPGTARKVLAPLPTADRNSPDGELTFALSPDGRRLAYTSTASGGVTVVDIVTGMGRTWADPGSWVHGLGWAKDGRRLWLRMAETLKVLDTTRPGAPLAQAARPVTTLPNAFDGVVTPDDQAVIVFNGSRIERRPLSGGAARTLARLDSSADGLGGLTLDGSGRFALYTQGWRIHRVDLSTGRTASFPVPTGKRQGKGDAPGVAW